MASEPSTVARMKIARRALAKPWRLLGWLLLLLVPAMMWMDQGPHLLTKLGLADPHTVSFIGVLAIFAGFIAYLSLSGHVLIGSDGVYIDRRDDQRYVPFDDIAHVARYRQGLMGKEIMGALLTLRDGEILKLPTNGLDQRAELMTRLEAALSAYRKHQRPEGAELMTSKGQTSDAWLEQLQRIGAGANAGPRAAPTSPEQLWRIVESPASGAEARAGAAAALAERLDDEGKTRLRVVSDATAAPKLRIALDCAQRSDDEAMLQALEELRDEQRQHQS